MKIVVASGKGGTGKSMFASSLALLFSEETDVVACDCDVDAPNLGLWLGVTTYDRVENISTSERARINPEKCIACGKCFETCVFGAIEKRNTGFRINPLLCEGCGACQLVCPTEAIDINPVMNGALMIKNTPWGFPLVSGQLRPGETGSGKIVQELRKKADTFSHKVMVLDAAAGIGCPEIVNHFEIPYGVVLNKWDINIGMSQKVEEWSGDRFLGKLSYDREVVNSIVNLKPVIVSNSKVKNEIRDIFKKMRQIL